MSTKKQLQSILPNANVTGPIKSDSAQEIRAHMKGVINNTQLNQLSKLGQVSIKRSGDGLSVSVKTH